MILEINGSAKAIGPILVPLALEYAPVLDAIPANAMLLTVFIHLAFIHMLLLDLARWINFEFALLDQLVDVQWTEILPFLYRPFIIYLQGLLL